MDHLDPLILDHLRSRRPVEVRTLFWVVARSRLDPAALFPTGFWDGGDTEEVVVVDPETGWPQARVFAGAGGLAVASPVEAVTGFDIHPLVVGLSPINRRVADAVRGYNIRWAPATVFKGYRDPEKARFIAPPRAVFEGHVNKAPIETPAEGGEGELRLTLVPVTREETVGNPARSSDATQRRRLAGTVPDRILRYADIAHRVPIVWGEKKGRRT